MPSTITISKITSVMVRIMNADESFPVRRLMQALWGLAHLEGPHHKENCPRYQSEMAYDSELSRKYPASSAERSHSLPDRIIRAIVYGAFKNKDHSRLAQCFQDYARLSL